MFATAQTAETDCLLGGKADSCQGQHQRACPARLGTPWIVLNGVPGKSGGDGAGDKRATYTNIVKFLELCIGPLFSEFIGFLRISGVEEIGDGIVHGRPCCENDGKCFSSLSNEPDYNPAGTEKIRMTLPPLRELLH